MSAALDTAGQLESVLIDVHETALATRAVANIASRSGLMTAPQEGLALLSPEELASLMRVLAGRLEASYTAGQALLSRRD